MKPFLVNTEVGERIITTKEEAMKLITASAKSWFLTEEEARNEVPLFKDIAKRAGLNLNNLVAYKSQDSNDYPYTFKWEVVGRYVKKPVQVIAWQFVTQEPLPDWVECAIEKGLVTRVIEPIDDEEYLLIRKDGGNLVVREHDFIIDGGGNDFYPCEESIFYKTYEEVK